MFWACRCQQTVVQRRLPAQPAVVWDQDQPGGSEGLQQPVPDRCAPPPSSFPLFSLGSSSPTTTPLSPPPSSLFHAAPFYLPSCLHPSCFIFFLPSFPSTFLFHPLFSSASPPHRFIWMEQKLVQPVFCFFFWSHKPEFFHKRRSQCMCGDLERLSGNWPVWLLLVPADTPTHPSSDPLSPLGSNSCSDGGGCAQLCLAFPGGHACACGQGFVLSAGNTSCSPVPDGQPGPGGWLGLTTSHSLDTFFWWNVCSFIFVIIYCCRFPLKALSSKCKHKENVQWKVRNYYFTSPWILSLYTKY